MPVTAAHRVPTSWTDYNGHMNETHYVEIASRASDRFMELIGADAAYIARGFSYFTAENVVRYLDEVKAGEALTVTTQVVGAAGKKLHLLQRISAEGRGEVAALETLLIHVDLTTRRSAPPPPDIVERIEGYVAAQSHLPRPEGLKIGPV